MKTANPRDSLHCRLDQIAWIIVGLGATIAILASVGVWAVRNQCGPLSHQSSKFVGGNMKPHRWINGRGWFFARG